MSNKYHKNFSDKALSLFLESAFQIAFGDSAIDKHYSMKEVIERLRSFSDDSYEANAILLGQYNSIDEFEKVKKEYLDRVVD